MNENIKNFPVDQKLYFNFIFTKFHHISSNNFHLSEQNKPSQLFIIISGMFICILSQMLSSNKNYF